MNSFLLGKQKDAEINSLKSELLKARSQIESLLDEKRYLEHSVKSSQVQHELSHDESDKIQNAQFHEITNLRQQIKFREQVKSILCKLTKFSNQKMLAIQFRNRWIS